MELSDSMVESGWSQNSVCLRKTQKRLKFCSNTTDETKCGHASHQIKDGAHSGDQT